MKLVPVHGYAALNLVDESLLILSDLHYGVEAEMLRGVVWVPNRSTSRTEKVLKLLKNVYIRYIFSVYLLHMPIGIPKKDYIIF